VIRWWVLYLGAGEREGRFCTKDFPNQFRAGRFGKLVGDRLLGIKRIVSRTKEEAKEVLFNLYKSGGW